MKNYKLIVFDLDGTLLDTSKGIFNSVRYAEKQMGFKPIKTTDLKKFVGPPPKEMYASIYNVNERKAQQAAQFHREYGRKYAIYEAEVYKGIPELLEMLQRHNCKLAVATLKSQKIAEEILEYYGIKKYFDSIVGMNEEESLTKAQTIMKAMEEVGLFNKQETLMVGDSMYDFQGAIECGISFIPVLYGFGFRNSFQAEGVLFCANEPIEIFGLVN